ncbi:hypothetical protein TNCV_4821321 [Trichonephila clavipes]|nr:hypothetical protein TNCV_4821321 [Trichonephila clavipes]
MDEPEQMEFFNIQLTNTSTSREQPSGYGQDAMQIHIELHARSQRLSVFFRVGRRAVVPSMRLCERRRAALSRHGGAQRDGSVHPFCLEGPSSQWILQSRIFW